MAWPKVATPFFHQERYRRAVPLGDENGRSRYPVLVLPSGRRSAQPGAMSPLTKMIPGVPGHH